MQNSLTLPDPHMTDAAPIRLYYEQCEKAVQEARAAYLARHSPEAFARLERASEALRQADLNLHGVKCPKCDGTGMVRYLDGAAEVQCGLCNGDRAVLPYLYMRFTNG